jgi:hypothetical protein
MFCADAMSRRGVAYSRSTLAADDEDRCGFLRGVAAASKLETGAFENGEVDML